MSVPIIPLFAEKPSHPFVPLGRRPASAHSEGQGRPPAGASRAPFTGASTLAGWRRSGVGAAVGLAVLLLVSPGAALAQNAPAERAAARHPYAVHVTDAARRFGLPEAWIWAVMRVESNRDARAVSSAGARGLMQIMPATWTGLRARYRFGRDPFDPRDNIMAGAAYLREMHDRYGNVTAMLAAYNAGPGRYDEHLSRGRPLPAETRAYLAKLASITGGRHAACRRATVRSLRLASCGTVPGARGRRFGSRCERRKRGHAHAVRTFAGRPLLRRDGRRRLAFARPVRPPVRRAAPMSGPGALWRAPSQPFAALEGGKALILQGEGRGQDKGRQCAKPMRPGCGLDSQGFRALLRNVCGLPALCGAGETPAAARVFRTLRSAAP